METYLVVAIFQIFRACFKTRATVNLLLQSQVQPGGSTTDVYERASVRL
jgi:hypothetical protein